MNKKCRLATVAGVAFLLILAFALMAVLVCCGGRAYAVEIEPKAEYTYRDLNELIQQANAADNRQRAAHKMAEAARELNYGEDHAVIQLAKEEWDVANGEYNEILLTVKALTEKQAQRAAEYPVATQIEEYLIEKGYDDAVIAGILGNFMVETGGGTLKLQPYASNSRYYGLAQWSIRYFPAVVGADTTEQMDFLISNISAEFDAFGYLAGLTYDEFLSLTDPREAALAFAKVYERCGSGTYKLRQNCAVEAYNYFFAG